MKTLNIVLVAVMVLFVISYSLTPVRSDNDVWWHLKTGRILWESRSLPEHDVLAYTSGDIPWHNHEWLAQVIMYGFYLLGDGTLQGGMRMVILLKALALLASFVLLFIHMKRDVRSVPIAVLGVLWAVILSRRTIYPRPPVFTYFFFILFLFLMHEVHEKRIPRRWIWILCPLMVLWVNTHGGFLLGIIIAGAYFAGELYPVVVRRVPYKDTGALPYGLLLAALLLCSLVNPYSWHLYLLPGRVMSDTGLVRAIPELLSPDFFFTRGLEALLLFLIAAPFLVKKPVLNIAEGLLLLFFLHNGVQHVRHVPLAGMIAIPICARYLRELAALDLPQVVKRAIPAVICLLIAAVAGYNLLNCREGESFLDRNMNYFSGEGYYESRYPVKEADFILANDFQGRMYNQINYAGYLIWRMSPESHKVFTDSRYDIFGGRFMRQEQAVQQGID
ncbi:MAG TPA: hypothetical protein PLB62_13715, partial [Candidatus Sumerlaeota bacterium]|nr:hypothetical protein [Candidatus Sumerlaeota bacterium]